MSKKVKRLFAQFQPENYNLQLDPSRETMQLKGSVTVRGRKTGRPAQRLVFHQKGLKITKATIIKIDKKGEREVAVARINHLQSFNEVRLHAGEMLYPGEYVVAMEFAGKVQPGMHGVYVCNYELEGQKRQLVATQFESHHAREAFPCIDEPEAKATFDLTLSSPAGEAVIGNAPAKTSTEKNGRRSTTFETTPRMSTYLLAFVYGDLQRKTAKTKSGIEVNVWSTKTHRPEALDFGLDVATRAIEFFEDYYDTPYPLAKCDFVALPDFSSGAMENWGLITFREVCLLADPDTASQSGREVIGMVVAHEVSHQWFGNLVTMKWWDDLWLNESFATVMEYVAVDSLFPEWKIWNKFVAQEGLAAIRRDSIAGVQAIKTEVRHPDEISTLFDPSIVYAKGGRLLNMLMQYLGKEAFRKGLKAYFKAHAYQNTTGDDLWQALGTASNKDVAGFMEPWLKQSGFPVVEVTQKNTHAKLTQSHFLLDPAKADRERLWPVPLLPSVAAMPALLDRRSLEFTLPADEPVRINRGGVGHYVAHYTAAAHRQALAKMVEAQQLDAAERLILLSDSSMLARVGRQTFADTLRLLSHYTKEDSEPVWDVMALIIADARRFIDLDATLEEPIKALLRRLITTQYNRLGWEEKAQEPSQDTKLRATILGLGSYAEEAKIVDQGQKLFEAQKTAPEAVPSELRAIVFGIAVRNGSAGAFDYLLDAEEKTQNVDLKHDILAALTLTKNTKEVGRLLKRLKDPTKVRQQDLHYWLVYLLRSRYGRTQAWQWLRDNWPWIEQTFDGDKSYDDFPRYAAGAFNTPELLNEYRAFFGPMQEIPALNRNIAMGIEELENRVAWLERDLPGTKTQLTA